MSTLTCPTKEQNIKLQEILSVYNPDNSNRFEMPLCELFKYFPSNRSQQYDFNPAPDNNQLKSVAISNNWKVKMIYTEKNDFFKQKIEFIKLNPDEPV